MTEYYMGLLSGTSMDGIDAAIVDFTTQPPRLINTHSINMPADIQQELRQLCFSGENEINRTGKMDVRLGKLFAKAANELLEKANYTPNKIIALGSHGQTIRHHPNQDHPFTLQIGDPHIIAAETGITTVADFRRKDIALGGQGAPLTPAFHEYLFRDNKINRAVVNIGGFANLTFLPKEASSAIEGYDTGPGNWLMDTWIKKHCNQPYDNKGQWAQSGTVISSLLTELLTDPYFKKALPKSTGPEYFNLAWLDKHLSGQEKPEDIQATLLELTSMSIAKSIKDYQYIEEVLLCGGGVNNNFLLTSLRKLLPNHSLLKTDDKGIPAQWMEAMAFAWFAKQTIEKKPLHIASVTGAKQNMIAGAIYY